MFKLDGCKAVGRYLFCCNSQLEISIQHKFFITLTLGLSTFNADCFFEELYSFFEVPDTNAGVASFKPRLSNKKAQSNVRDNQTVAQKPVSQDPRQAPVPPTGILDELLC